MPALPGATDAIVRTTPRGHLVIAKGYLPLTTNVTHWLRIRKNHPNPALRTLEIDFCDPPPPLSPTPPPPPPHPPPPPPPTSPPPSHPPPSAHRSPHPDSPSRPSHGVPPPRVVPRP